MVYEFDFSQRPSSRLDTLDLVKYKNRGVKVELMYFLRSQYVENLPADLGWPLEALFL